MKRLAALSACLDEELDLIDDIATNCWSPSDAELFDGFAVIDQELHYYGELDGDEADCAFAPVADHPDPGDAFVNLPEEGEWDDLELYSELDCAENPLDPDCRPLFEDEPYDLECIPFCDDEPRDPECIWYCDWFDDPESCD